MSATTSATVSSPSSASTLAPAAHALHVLVPAHAPWLDSPEIREQLLARVRLARWGAVAGTAFLGILVFLLFQSGASSFPYWPVTIWGVLVLWTAGAIVDLGIAVSVTGGMLLALEEENDGSHFYQSSLLASVLGLLLGGVFPGFLLFRAHRGFFGPAPPEPEPKPRKEKAKAVEPSPPAEVAPGAPPAGSMAPGAANRAPVAAAPAPLPPLPPPPPDAAPLPPPPSPALPSQPSSTFVVPGAPPPHPGFSAPRSYDPGPSPSSVVAPPTPNVPYPGNEPLGPPACPHCGFERRPGDVTCRQCGSYFMS